MVANVVNFGPVAYIWKGELDSPPNNPSQNWVYRDSTDKAVYLYDKGKWALMVKDGIDGSIGKTPEFRLNENKLQWKYAEDSGNDWIDLFTFPAFYEKPSTGIPETDLDDGVKGDLEKARTALQSDDLPDFVTENRVSEILTAHEEDENAHGINEIKQAIEDLESSVGGGGGNSGYNPPVGGIPKSDLAQSVRNSLDKADTALQSFNETDPVYSADKPDLALKSDLASLAADADLNTEIQDRIDGDSGLASQISDVRAIAEGRSRARVFSDVAELDAWLLVQANVEALNVGDNFFIVDTDVPDYWWDGAQKQPLETEKVNLTDYYTKSQINNLLQSKLDVTAFNTAMGLKTDLTDFNTHANNTEKHVTAQERIDWNSKQAQITANAAGNGLQLLSQADGAAAGAITKTPATNFVAQSTNAVVDGSAYASFAAYIATLPNGTYTRTINNISGWTDLPTGVTTINGSRIVINGSRDGIVDVFLYSGGVGLALNIWVRTYSRATSQWSTGAYAVWTLLSSMANVVTLDTAQTITSIKTIAVGKEIRNLGAVSTKSLGYLYYDGRTGSNFGNWDLTIPNPIGYFNFRVCVTGTYSGNDQMGYLEKTFNFTLASASGLIAGGTSQYTRIEGNLGKRFAISDPVQPAGTANSDIVIQLSALTSSYNTFQVWIEWLPTGTLGVQNSNQLNKLDTFSLGSVYYTANPAQPIPVGLYANNSDTVHFTTVAAATASGFNSFLDLCLSLPVGNHYLPSGITESWADKPTASSVAGSFVLIEGGGSQRHVSWFFQSNSRKYDRVFRTSDNTWYTSWVQVATTIDTPTDRKYGWGGSYNSNSTVAKTAGIANFKKETGSVASVIFVAKNIANNPTLNINNTGASPIWCEGSAINSSNHANAIEKGVLHHFAFNGTQWELLNPADGWTNVNNSLQFESNTAYNTAAKVTTVTSGYARPLNGAVIVKFTGEEGRGKMFSSLDVGGSGASPVYYNGRQIEPGLITHGTEHIFVWNGVYWELRNPTFEQEVSYGVCDDLANASTKNVLTQNFDLHIGAVIAVTFTNGNSVTNPSLVVANSGSYPLKYNGNNLTTAQIPTGHIALCVFRGTEWDLLNPVYQDVYSTTETDTGKKYNNKTVYRRQFQGNITAAANATVSTILLSAGVADLLVMGGGVWDNGAGYKIQAGSSTAAGGAFPQLETSSSFVVANNNALTLQTTSNQARTNAVYDVWAEYTKQ